MQILKNDKHVPRTRLLLVEDELTLRRFLHAVLQEEYAVEIAEDGEQAWVAVQRGVPDLVVSDVIMPGSDGFALTRRLRHNPATAKVPVVLYTADGYPRADTRAQEAGADAMLCKPFELGELRRTLRQVTVAVGR